MANSRLGIANNDDDDDDGDESVFRILQATSGAKNSFSATVASHLERHLRLGTIEHRPDCAALSRATIAM
ncbi:predicted protein [Plenodomus lingam JN3]|uniref:Uncharacterized protein n=1 Tax=Leptosphaeria maculans (strain JN3 / isolate v23.1.3 / race Av1-4-5-6-7-8) TaxID=985895 RepID=E5A7A8_LEPMJ|nr:predicted protein [Plenodomus lingam JN3]CBX99503.1 predicted protein [Plenodomus lingam JN3]